MSNEQYLIISYFVVATACVGLAAATYALLSRSFRALTGTAPGGRLGGIFRKLFFAGIVLPAMAGFFSVSFRSCERQTYPEIIADRAYLMAKNQEQLGAAFSHIAVALLFWGLVVTVALAMSVNRRERAR